MSRQIDELTGLRWLLAVCVCASHINFAEGPHLLKSLAQSGYVGVNLFFILSGFVLSHVYNRTKVGFSEFMLKRMIRIAPVYYISALPFIVIYFFPDFQLLADGLLFGVFHRETTTLHDLLLFITFTQSLSFSFNSAWAINSPSWSVSTEMFFYLLFPVLLKCRTKSLLVLLLLLVMWLAQLTVNYQSIPLLQTLAAHPQLTVGQFLVGMFPLTRLPEFISGILIFRLYNNGFRLPKICFLMSTLALGIAALFSQQVNDLLRPSLYFLPFTTFFFLSFLTPSLGTKMFKSKTMIVLGHSSYCFYLFHLTLTQSVERLANRYLGVGQLTPLEIFLTSVLLISLVSVAIHTKVEKPIQNYLRKGFGKSS